MYCEDTRNVIDEFKNLPIDEIKRRIKRNNFSVCAMNIEKNINVGTMIRSCNAFAGREFILVGSKQWDRRGAVGTHHYETMVYLKTPQEFLEWAKDKKRTLVAVDYRPGFSIPSTQIDEYPENPIFIFGSEANGIPQEMFNACQLKVHVGQFGSIRSLNVGVACGIILYDWRTKHLPKDEV